MLRWISLAALLVIVLGERGRACGTSRRGAVANSAPGEGAADRAASPLPPSRVAGTAVHRAPVHRAPVHRAPVHRAPVHRAPVHRAPRSPSRRRPAPAAKGPPSIAAPPSSAPPAAPAGGEAFEPRLRLPRRRGGRAAGARVARARAAQERRSRAKKKAPKKPVDSILCIEVEEGDHEVPPAIEEAAVLYANGQTAEAHARLKKALEGEDLGAWKLQVWLMLFDVLQQLGPQAGIRGARARFRGQVRALAAGVDRCADRGARAEPHRCGPAARRPSRSPARSAPQSAGALDQLRRPRSKQPKLRLDFGKLQGIEPAGCTLLRATLRGLQDGEEGRLAHRRGDAPPAPARRRRRRATSRSTSRVWLLLLDLYQMLGLQNEFEEAAVDYAVTYEVSPPSWEAPPPRPKPLEMVAAAIGRHAVATTPS